MRIAAISMFVLAGATFAGAQAAPAVGTKFKAELVTKLDSGKAKVGDKVLAKVQENVKSGGATLIAKNMMLEGRVTKVVPSENKSESNLGVVFEQVTDKSRVVMPLRACIVNIPPEDNGSNLAKFSTPAEMAGGSHSTLPNIAMSGGGAVDSGGAAVLFSMQADASDAAHDMGGVMTNSKGNLKLEDGTHIEVQVLSPIPASGQS